MKNLNRAEIRSENEGAFTLVELLVVILIIGILAAIAIPAFLNQRKAAVDSSVESDVKNASTQIETWAVGNPNSEIPEFSVNGDGTVDNLGEVSPGENDLAATFEVGEGTDVFVDGGLGTGVYHISGTNEDGNRAADEGGINFISNQGGMQ